MSTIYTIHIHNESPSRKRFVLYQDSPMPDNDSTMYGSIWLTDSVGAGAQGSLEVTADFYAWAGTTKEPLSDGVQVSGGMVLPVNLGQDGKKGSTIGAEVFEDPPSIDIDLKVLEDGAGPSAYQIEMGPFTEGDHRVLIGLGKLDEHKNKIPVASFNPHPSQTYTLKPILKGKIVVNDRGQVGEALNYESISAFPGEFDFASNPGKFNASVTFDNQGRFSTTYY